MVSSVRFRIGYHLLSGEVFAPAESIVRCCGDGVAMADYPNRVTGYYGLQTVPTG